MSVLPWISLRTKSTFTSPTSESLSYLQSTECLGEGEVEEGSLDSQQEHWFVALIIGQFDWTAPLRVVILYQLVQ